MAFARCATQRLWEARKICGLQLSSRKKPFTLHHSITEFELVKIWKRSLFLQQSSWLACCFWTHAKALLNVLLTAKHISFRKKSGIDSGWFDTLAQHALWLTADAKTFGCFMELTFFAFRRSTVCTVRSASWLHWQYDHIHQRAIRAYSRPFAWFWFGLS